jgi:hypothetical protein
MEKQKIVKYYSNYMIMNNLEKTKGATFTSNFLPKGCVFHLFSIMEIVFHSICPCRLNTKISWWTVYHKFHRNDDCFRLMGQIYEIIFVSPNNF